MCEPDKRKTFWDQVKSEQLPAHQRSSSQFALFKGILSFFLCCSKHFYSSWECSLVLNLIQYWTKMSFVVLNRCDTQQSVHYRGFFVWRVRRTFFPSGWYFSTFWPRAGFLTSVCVRIQSVQSIKINKLSKVGVILKKISLGSLFDCPRLSLMILYVKLF